jgi:hypothetical protein
VQKFESKERNPKRQESFVPIKRVLTLHGPDQAREEVAVLEDDEKQNCLDNTERAKPGGRLVESADEGFPQKNEKASRSNDPTQLCVRKIDEEKAAARDDYPWPDARSRNAENDGGGKQKKKVVVPSIEDHERESAVFSALLPS